MMAGTAAAGVLFMLMHLNEWRGLASIGVTVSDLFGATFFTLTGLHMLHVAGGVLYLSILAIGRPSLIAVETAALYWQFVDAVWLVLFPVLYLPAVKS
jgi:heme/copper-type cytochrome/quinol oxidase subunit 3